MREHFLIRPRIARKKKTAGVNRPARSLHRYSCTKSYPPGAWPNACLYPANMRWAASVGTYISALNPWAFPLDRGHPPACRAGAEGEEMNRLRRFHETVPHGQTSCRVAYATSASALFGSLSDVAWAEDTEFNAIRADPTLKSVYREAILNGWAEAKGKS